MKIAKVIAQIVVLLGAFQTVNGMEEGQRFHILPISEQLGGEATVVLKNETNKTINAFVTYKGNLVKYIVKPKRSKRIVHVNEISITELERKPKGREMHFGKTVLIQHPIKGPLTYFKPSGENPEVTITVKKDAGKIKGHLQEKK